MAGLGRMDAQHAEKMEKLAQLAEGGHNLSKLRDAG